MGINRRSTVHRVETGFSSRTIISGEKYWGFFVVLLLFLFCFVMFLAAIFAEK